MLSPQLQEASQRFTLKYGMTPRETQVFNFFLEGMVPEEAATHLGLSLNTIRNHVKGQLKATQTNSISMLLAKFIRESFAALVVMPPKPPEES
jgi:DNA-binding CsgD family transcriptional regulator